MYKPRFSIITPVHVGSEQRRDQLLRCIESVKNQTFTDFEHIVVNDGSTLDFELPSYNWMRVAHQRNNERVIALNVGLGLAQGEWICFLDSDDEYRFNALNEMDQTISKNSKYLMFNFGCSYSHPDGTVTKRAPFKPKKLKVGHEVFGGGNIVNGTFIFHKSVYDTLGAYPADVVEDVDTTEINYPPFTGASKPYLRVLNMNTPYDFSAYAQVEFPEIRQFFMVNHEAEPHKIIKEMGNPWGNDYYLFYKYTRKYHSKPVDKYLLMVYPRP